VAQVPKELQRLVDQIDGWLELRCADKALELLTPLLDRPEARATGLSLRVRACVQVKRHKDALRDLAELRSLQYDPDWVDLTEAWCRKRSADLPGAVRLMEQLVERNPKLAIGHFNLGCYLALTGERERALDEVTLACGLKPEMRMNLHDEPDLDSLRRDARFEQLLAARGDADASDDIDDEVLGGFHDSDLGDAEASEEGEEGDEDDAGFEDDDDDDEGDEDDDDDEKRR
jgi:hypothetical protein